MKAYILLDIWFSLAFLICEFLITQIKSVSGLSSELLCVGIYHYHSCSLFPLQFIEGTMVSPTVYARRSLCYLFSDQPDTALLDAMQAQCVYPDWPTAFYMQSVALAKLNMHTDATDMLNEGAALEEKKQRGKAP